MKLDWAPRFLTHQSFAKRVKWATAAQLTFHGKEDVFDKELFVMFADADKRHVQQTVSVPLQTFLSSHHTRAALSQVGAWNNTVAIGVSLMRMVNPSIGKLVWDLTNLYSIIRPDSKKQLRGSKDGLVEIGEEYEEFVWSRCCTFRSEFFLHGL